MESERFVRSFYLFKRLIKNSNLPAEFLAITDKKAAR